jgi:hypothetical protein
VSADIDLRWQRELSVNCLILFLVVELVVAPWLFLEHAHDYGAHRVFDRIAMKTASKKAPLNPSIGCDLIATRRASKTPGTLPMMARFSRQFLECITATRRVRTQPYYKILESQ